MRQVRMLGLWVVTAFAIGAMTAVPVLAKETKEEKTEKKIWPVFKYCPYTDSNNEVNVCTVGVTSGGSKGGFYQLGAVKVPLNKPITLQGGLRENQETGQYYLVPAVNGGQTLESPALKVPGGLDLITPHIQELAGWPAALKEAFKEAKKSKDTGLTSKIEVAGGNTIFETEGILSIDNIIFEEGPAFKLPLKVKMSSPFLEKLGGGPCEVGNETTPIWQYLTTEPAQDGTAGSFEALDGGNLVVLRDSRLGAFGWPVEPAANASGCGGEYESYVDAAINDVLGLTSSGQYSAHGVTILVGSLYAAKREAVQEKLEG